MFRYTHLLQTSPIVVWRILHSVSQIFFVNSRENPLGVLSTVTVAKKKKMAAVANWLTLLMGNLVYSWSPNPLHETVGHLKRYF